MSIETFAADGRSQGVVTLPKIVKTDAEWRAQLSPAAYRVARREGTEAPYSGEYAESHGDGLYRCICCDTALYDSKTKFESGTGWPSFWQPISARNIVKSSDSSFGSVTPFPAAAVMPIWVMCSTTARSRRDCAIA